MLILERSTTIIHSVGRSVGWWWGIIIKVRNAKCYYKSFFLFTTFTYILLLLDYPPTNLSITPLHGCHYKYVKINSLYMYFIWKLVGSISTLWSGLVTVLGNIQEFL